MKDNLKKAQSIMLEILIEIDRICVKHSIEYWLTDGSLLGAIRHKGFIPWDDDLDIGMLREDYEKFKKVALLELKDDIFLQTSQTDFGYPWGMVPLKLRSSKGIIIEKGEEEGKYNNGIFVDIFAFDKFSQNNLKRKIQYLPKILLELKTTRLWTNKKNLKNIMKIIFIIPSQKLISPKFIINLSKLLNKSNENYVLGYGFDLTWRKVFDKEDIFPLKKREFEGVKVKVPKNSHKYLKKIYGEDYMEIPPLEKRLTHAQKIVIFKGVD